MAANTLLVVGAAGDVGSGVVAEALASGRKVIAAGRKPESLAALARRHNTPALACIQGDISCESGAKTLWQAASSIHGGPADVVVAVKGAGGPRQLALTSAGELSAALQADLLTHFNAARIFLPLMTDSALLIGIGGGTADFIFPGLAHVSMAQAALRMMYRGFAREFRKGASPRELMIVSMVAGESNRRSAQPDWLSDREVGRHVCAILDRPDEFPGPILRLASRDQVGWPED